jgi:general secretion pathway protein I
LKLPPVIASRAGPAEQDSGRAPRLSGGRTRAASRGFTLIEALVALVLVVVSITAIGSVVATTTRGVRSLEQHVSLIETARTVANDLPPRTQLAPGAITGENLGHRWRVDVSPFVGAGIEPVADSQWVPEMVTIRVQSPAGAILGLETVRLRRRQVQ